MSLSVVIVSYNTREALLECIESVFAHSPAGTQVVVVDNGSADGSVEAVRTTYPDVVVDAAEENLGFARGVNRGVARSSGEHLVLLNPDTIVLDGALESLEAFAVAHPEFGVYGGRTLRRDGSVDKSSCWGAPTLWSLTCFATGLSTAFSGSALFDPESLGGWQRDTVRAVPIVTGCLLLMRRGDWDRLGGMDERFFLYGEDAEFSIRAGRFGLRPVIVPTAEIIHDVGGSTGNSGFKMCMVLAGKTTLLRAIWSPRRSRIGIALLLTGVWMRAGLERLTRRRNGTWSTPWVRRSDWLPGYPAARRTLFGLDIDG
ncbi:MULTISPECIES: glycosyltransferase family 2 protein [Microbacterium]|uniref:glycosyltransferase family 2 protein n=1 Tax=Microbacterium TaxID=33882 RepID=UPI000D64E741|nr:MULTISPECIES: glycosyltransferase family 2 protein [Microbacterium]